MKLHICVILFCFILSLQCCTKQLPPGNIADKEATRETVILLNNLKKMARKGIMTGHQDALSYGLDWIDVEGRCDLLEASGDYPPVFGWDLGHLELGHKVNLDGVPFDKIRKHAIDVYNMGGVNTFSWHADNPLTGGNTWDVSSDSVVYSILPGGEKNKLFNTWLDALAGFFISLKDNDGKLIPVMFRPYHEHTGNWFWWCTNVCTVEQYKNLWIYTMTYLRNKGVHNLIIGYSSSGCDNEHCFLQRYPGDEYVDLIGYDDYQHKDDTNDKFREQVSRRMDIIVRIAAARDKLVALTEVGYLGIPEKKWFTEVLLPALKGKNISYFLMWRNFDDKAGEFFAPFPGHHSAIDYTEAIQLPDVFSLKEIDKMYE